MKNFWEPSTCLSQDAMRRYLREEITTNERQQIEHHLLDCQLCSAALEGYAAMEEDVLEEDLQELSRQRPYAPPEKSKSKQTNWWRMAAAILVVAVLGSIWFYTQASKSESLYASYMDPTPINRFEEVRVVGQGPALPAQLTLALEAYKTEQYDRAAAAFRTYLDQGVQDERARLYLGVSHLMQGRTQEAAAHLDTVSWQDPSLISEALWYKSLTALYDEDTAAAKALLESVVERKGDRSVEAREMLGFLRSEERGARGE